MRRMVLAAGLSAATMFGGAAFGAPLSATDLLAGYNLITLGNASTNSDIEGAAIVGGNLDGATMFNRTPLPGFSTSYVFGNASGSINVNNGGNLYIGGSDSATINMNGGGTRQVGGSGGIAPAFTMADVTDALESYAAALETLGANGTITVASNKATFSYSGSGQAVFDLTAAELTADLNGASSLLFDVGSAPTVVNVDLEGGSWTEPGGLNLNPPAFPNVLFNFYDGGASSTVGLKGWETSVLALDSTVTNNSAIEGSVAARNFQGGGELHDDTLTSPPLPPPTVPVPEPASWTLLLAGLLGLGWACRKARAA